MPLIVYIAFRSSHPPIVSPLISDPRRGCGSVDALPVGALGFRK
jgi:hypothetical protein